jgi:hypothetical protein
MMLHRSFFVRLQPAAFLVAALALMPVAGSGAVPADPRGPADGEVVELPQFVVTEQRDLPPPEKWRYSSTPSFEILSSLSERETRRFVRDFHLLQQVVEVVWPALARARRGPPGLVILCNRDGEFESFLPRERHDRVDMPTSVFVQDDERAGIVVDFIAEVRAETLSAPDPAEGDEAGPSAGVDFMAENDPYRQFYLQYFRAMIRRATGKAPYWLEEGLVNLLASIDFSRRFVEVGGVGGGNSLDFTSRLSRTALLPFEDIFSDRRPERYQERIHAAQCYAFVHLSLYGENRRHQAAFQKLIEYALHGPVTEEIFKECYGMTYKQLALALRGYVQFTNYKRQQFRAVKGSAGFDDRDFPVRDATQAEVGRIKGEVYRLAGYPDHARLALIAPYVRGERDSELLAALGLHELHETKIDRARTFLEAAAKGDLRRPRAWLELARLRLAEAERTTTARAGSLTEAQFNAVREPLLKARAQPPPLPEVYEELALLWAESDRTPEAGDLRVLYEGVQRFPLRMKLLYIVASLAVKFGDTTDARALVEHGLEHGLGGVRPHFEELRAVLPPPP